MLLLFLYLTMTPINDIKAQDPIPRIIGSKLRFIKNSPAKWNIIPIIHDATIYFESILSFKNKEHTSGMNKTVPLIPVAKKLHDMIVES